MKSHLSADPCPWSNRMVTKDSFVNHCDDWQQPNDLVKILLILWEHFPKVEHRNKRWMVELNSKQFSQELCDSMKS